MNSLSVPSQAEYFMRIESVEDLQTARARAEDKNLKVLVLGDGTNLVLPTKISSLVLKIGLLGKQVVQSDTSDALVELAAGENWHAAVEWCLQQGLYGIENLALIPGSVGAAPVQNIGAYGVELNDCLDSLEYFDLQSGELRKLSNAECEFQYRNSRFKTELRDRAIITRIWLRLSKVNSADYADATNASYPSLKDYLQQKQLEATPQNIFAAVCDVRRQRLPDPLQEPNVGSFFHNPVITEQHYRELKTNFADMPGFATAEGEIKVPAAWLIEQLGWKGKTISGVGISARHALVLINPHHKDAETVLEAARAIQDSVQKEFAIQLNIEPRVAIN